MQNFYNRKELLVLENPEDVIFTRRCHGAENTMSTYQRKGISTLALTVSAVISGMLYPSGAVAEIKPLTPQTSMPINGEYYVSMGANDPRTVSEEIKSNANLSLYGNIADDNAEGAVNNKTFIIGSTFTYGGSSGNDKLILLYAGYSKGSGAVTGNTLNFSGSIDPEHKPDDFFLYGGYSIFNSANKNSVTISRGELLVDDDMIVYGGWSNYGSANENEVTISGGEL